MAEEKKLNIFQKIQKARVDLQKKDLKKTGYNKYSNYYYFELGDFLPQINEICDKLGLYCEFQYEEKSATLSIYDTDSDNLRIWATPVEVAELKGCSTIQNIGGTQSFARRYLYMMAFEIAETDAIDNGGVDADAELAKQKINKASVLTIKSLINDTNTDEKQFLSWAGVPKVEDIVNAALGTCINMLNKKKKDNETKANKIKKEQEEHQKKLQIEQEDFQF
jgi:hypothetical protein